MKRKNKSSPGKTGTSLIFLGIGIVAVCIFPSEWMVVMMAIGLIVAGIALMKH